MTVQSTILISECYVRRYGWRGNERALLSSGLLFFEQQLPALAKQYEYDPDGRGQDARNASYFESLAI